MPRRPRPFGNEPRPTGPNPVAYANDPEGLKEARRVFKRRYDSWNQRKRRAIARGEVVTEDGAPHTPPPVPDTPQPLAPFVQPLDPTLTGPPDMMLVIPARMVSLLATRPTTTTTTA